MNTPSHPKWCCFIIAANDSNYLAILDGREANLFIFLYTIAWVVSRTVYALYYNNYEQHKHVVRLEIPIPDQRYEARRLSERGRDGIQKNYWIFHYIVLTLLMSDAEAIWIKHDIQCKKGFGEGITLQRWKAGINEL